MNLTTFNAEPLNPIPVMKLVAENLAMAVDLLSQAERAVINDDASLAIATDFLKICQSRSVTVETIRKGQVTPLNDHVSWINGEWKAVTTGLASAKAIVQKKATTYAQEVQAALRAAQAAQRKAIEDAAIKAAEEAQAKGRTEIADLILDSTANARPLVAAVASSRGSMTGASSSLRDFWKGSVTATDIRTVCAAIASGVLPTDIIIFNQANLNKIAKDIAKEGVYHGITIVNDAKLVAQ